MELPCSSPQRRVLRRANTKNDGVDEESCEICDGEGHNRVDCYLPYLQERKQKKLCIKCGRSDHHIKDCRYPSNSGMKSRSNGKEEKSMSCYVADHYEDEPGIDVAF